MYDSDKLLTRVKAASSEEGRVWVAGGARRAPAGLPVPLGAHPGWGPSSAGRSTGRSEKVLGPNPWQFSFPSCFSEEEFSKGCQHLVTWG